LQQLLVSGMDTAKGPLQEHMLETEGPTVSGLKTIMNALVQWWIEGLRTRKAYISGSVPRGRFTADFPYNRRFQLLLRFAVEHTTKHG